MHQDSNPQCFGFELGPLPVELEAIDFTTTTLRLALVGLVCRTPLLQLSHTLSSIERVDFRPATRSWLHEGSTKQFSGRQIHTGTLIDKCAQMSRLSGQRVVLGPTRMRFAKIWRRPTVNCLHHPVRQVASVRTLLFHILLLNAYTHLFK